MVKLYPKGEVIGIKKEEKMAEGRIKGRGKKERKGRLVCQFWLDVSVHGQLAQQFLGLWGGSISQQVVCG